MLRLDVDVHGVVSWNAELNRDLSVHVIAIYLQLSGDSLLAAAAVHQIHLQTRFHRHHHHHRHPQRHHRALILYRRRRFINHLLTYLLTY